MARRPLTPGTPEQAGLDAVELAGLVAAVDALPARGWCGGAVVAAGRGPHLVVEHATGWAVRWASATEPAAHPVPATPDTPFDLASLTKLFTAVVAVQQLERGAFALDEPVAAHVPEFGAAGKGHITPRQLLTHTSGLRPELPFHDGHGLELLWAEPPTRGGPCYSDLNLLALQAVLERTSGRRLDTLVRDGVTGPLGLTSTRFGPVPEAAATEDQRRPVAKADRGMLRGVVHDENAHALGGVTGHAGLFSTVRDLATLCRALLAGGTVDGVRLLAPESVGLLLDAPGLGFAVDQPWFMGKLAGRGAAGHTGFTGTSLVLDRATDTFLVLLATTVHPVRPRRPDSGPRAVAASHLARAVR
ncbi:MULTISPECIES: serine hydrolase domain-containing protein [unclassified Streptomyces]|uniref:serine hydrolase domain-containing protein n=1 Tax=unclassified Streptomyces TaxID=2593676 RepID=UPI0022B5F3B3|nr:MULTISPECIES: serine hydrolase domain-containing protein [unclassified Streptomyces]MCZ7414009.1 serine hydrolase [Streptomyces sp. WMMC897]MCZ7431004.1 serine hydrolase [Streptomyces sp. WMMC1477]